MTGSGVPGSDDETVGVCVGRAIFTQRHHQAGGAVGASAGAPQFEFLLGGCSAAACEDSGFPVASRISRSFFASLRFLASSSSMVAPGWGGGVPGSGSG
jgi:hypothetical protein